MVGSLKTFGQVEVEWDPEPKTLNCVVLWTCDVQTVRCAMNEQLLPQTINSILSQKRKPPSKAP